MNDREDKHLTSAPKLVPDRESKPTSERAPEQVSESGPADIVGQELADATEQKLADVVEQEAALDSDKKESGVNTTVDFIEGETIEHASEKFNQDDFKYEAFISYRHVEPDATIAAAIHKMVETFRVPKEFYRDGKRPVFRVFRDREELTTTNLSDSLDEALHSSKFLIVICSKRTPLSPWCVREVEEFKKIRGEEYIIPVLVEGEPAESFPPPIRNLKRVVTKDDGTTTEESHEILAAELRPAEVQQSDFVGYEKLQEDRDPNLDSLRKEALSLLKVEKYRIMAAILGCTYGDLKQRDKERRTRTLLGISAVVAAALLFFGIFMIDAYRSENAARREAVQSNSAILLDTARRELQGGDRIMAALVAGVAMDEITPEMPRYDALQSQYTGILNDTVFISDAAASTVIPTDNAFTTFLVSPDSKAIIAGLGNRELGIWNAKTGELLQRLSGGATEQYASVNISPDGKLLATGNYDDTIRIWRTEDLVFGEGKTLAVTSENPAPVMEIQAAGSAVLTRFSYDGKYLYTISDGYLINTIQTYSVETGAPVGEKIEVSATQRSSVSSYDFSPSAYRMAMTFSTTDQDRSLILYDLEKGEEIRSFPDYRVPLDGTTDGMPQNYAIVRFSSDGKEIYTQAYDHYTVFDVGTGETLREYRLDDRLSSEINHPKILEVPADNAVYLNFEYDILKYNLETGEALARISIGSGSLVVDFDVNDEGTLIALRDDASIAMAVRQIVVSSGIDYGEGKAERVQFTPNGERLITLSRLDRNIKIIELASSEDKMSVPGLVAVSTADRKHTLMYNLGDLWLRDNETGEIKAVPETAYAGSGATVPSDLLQFGELSNDTETFVYVGYADTDGDGIGDTSRLRVVNPLTGEEKWHQTEDFINTRIGISPDNQEVLQVSHSGEAARRNAATGEVIENYKLKRGYVLDVLFSEDASVVGVVYDEGSTILYNYPEMSVIDTIPGLAMSLTRDADGKLNAYSVYNNSGIHWIEGKDRVEIALPQQRESMGTSNQDLNVFDPESGYLLSIMRNKNPDKTNNAYLIDFSSGQLLKTFEIDLIDYNTPSGLILPGGAQILMDDNYTTELENPEEEDYMSRQYTTTTVSSLIRLLDREMLQQRAKQMVGGRTMTVDELREIGLTQ